MLDEQERFVPLTYDKLFKGIFKENLDLLKIFILDQLEFDVKPDDCKVELFDSEMHMEFMRKVICMVSDRRFFEDWEQEKLNRYVEYKEKQSVRKDAREEGLKEGYQQGIERGLEKGIENKLLSIC